MECIIHDDANSSFPIYWASVGSGIGFPEPVWQSNAGIPPPLDGVLTTIPALTETDFMK
jgi:hypothetical protein